VKIVGVAIKLKDGKVTSLLAPNRHHHIFEFYRKQGLSFMDVRDNIQGFITESGDFVTREEAWDIALESGQACGMHGSILTSEDLW
jgi:hypothetical protein